MGLVQLGLVSTPQRIVPLLALVVLALALGYGFLPFNFAGAVDCQAPLLGADAKLPPTTVGFVRPETDCKSKGKTRLATVAFTTLFAAGAGLGVMFISPMSQECRSGVHDDCHGWWPSVFGSTGEGAACKCSCHVGQPAI